MISSVEEDHNSVKHKHMKRNIKAMIFQVCFSTQIYWYFEPANIFISYHEVVLCTVLKFSFSFF